jgi:hypothetical protein
MTNPLTVLLIQMGRIPRSLLGRIRSPPEVRHSRMLLAGIQGGMFGLDPRLKHSGVTTLGQILMNHYPIRLSAISAPSVGVLATGESLVPIFASDFG